MAVETLAPSELVERARALEPLVTRYRDQCEEERRLAAPLVDALREAGIFRVAVPRAFGGDQSDLLPILQLIEEFARYDGSVGWNVMIGAGGGFFADHLPEAAAHEVYDDPGTVVAGTFAPQGRAVAAPGGYRLSGRWSFASGCQYATWLMAGAVVMEDGQPRRTPEGQPDIQLFLVPTSQGEILDTWRTAGMRGTGSHDFQLNDVFVPPGRGFPFAQLLVGPVARPSTAYPQSTVGGVAAAIATVALGIARDAISSFTQLATSKTPTGGTMTLATQHTVHDRVGRAEALLRSARTYLFETARAYTATPFSTEADQTERLAAMRLAGAHAAQSAVDAVDLMFDAAGGTSLYATSRLERCFRDVHVITHHQQVAPSTFEMVGQYLLTGDLQRRR